MICSKSPYNKARIFLFTGFAFTLCLVYFLYSSAPGHLIYSTNQEHFASTCSWESDQRGPNQKVVAYSIYGNLSNPDLVRRYLSCFKLTLEKISETFPGWVARIYHNINSSDKAGWKNLLDTLPANRTFIDLCNATEIVKKRKLGNLFPRTWRFLPMTDGFVDIFLSRDTDSPLLSREEAAVREWLKSNKTFHSMRDNPQHCTPILAGLWGAKVSQNRLQITHSFNNIMAMNHSQNKDFDQRLLKEHIWPIAKTDVMAHDSYCCEKFSSQPFPTPRQGDKFVGMAILEGGRRNVPIDFKIEECPKPCRPKNSLFDWRYC